LYVIGSEDFVLQIFYNSKSIGRFGLQNNFINSKKDPFKITWIKSRMFKITMIRIEYFEFNGTKILLKITNIQSTIISKMSF